jgi:predicted RNase H-like nuclease
MILRGVDGCPKGWLAVSLDLATGKVSGQAFFEKETSLMLRDPSVAVTAIDIPIGLPSREMPRVVDGLARERLKLRASSVFPAPSRATLPFAGKDYEAACEASAAVCGKRLSQQSYAILPKIKAVDTILRENPELVERVFEVHPELSFYFWAGQEPMRHPKQSGFGFTERIERVRTVFENAAEEIRARIPRVEVNDDDILDAFAALWTAQRIHSGTAERLPKELMRDECGLPMCMWA